MELVRIPINNSVPRIKQRKTRLYLQNTNNLVCDKNIWFILETGLDFFQFQNIRSGLSVEDTNISCVTEISNKL